MPSFMIVRLQTSEIKRRFMRPDFSDNKEEEIRLRDFWAAVSVAARKFTLKINISWSAMPISNIVRLQTKMLRLQTKKTYRACACGVYV